MIADTDFFIDLMQENATHHEAATERQRQLEADAVPVYMTAITRFELFSGTERFHDPAEARSQVQAKLDRYPALALTPKAADRAGKVHGRLEVEGTPIGVPDAMIAAVALEESQTLLTRNVKHFERVQGLLLETY